MAFIDELFIRAFKCKRYLKTIDVENNEGDIILKGKDLEKYD